MSLKDRMESSPAVIFFSVFLLAFGTGFGSSQFFCTQNAGGSTISKEEKPNELEVQSFVINCNGKSKLCDEYLNLTVQTLSVLRIRYYVGDIQCHSIRLNFIVDGKPQAKSEFLGWRGAPPEYANLLLDTGFIDLGPVKRGTHLVRVQGEGQPGGCSKDGYIRSWGGSLRVVTSGEVTTGST